MSMKSQLKYSKILQDQEATDEQNASPAVKVIFA